jgi:hypothetical protein
MVKLRDTPRKMAYPIMAIEHTLFKITSKKRILHGELRDTPPKMAYPVMAIEHTRFKTLGYSRRCSQGMVRT